MYPITWNDLPSIHDVEEINETDEQCLEEIREILEKYRKTKRFGVALLHQHFTLSDDELLVEHCDIERRTLITAPVKATEYITHHYLPTV